MNWGKGITLTMIAFIAFIVVLVTMTMRDNDSLVEEDYYEKGLNHTEMMDLETNGQHVEVHVTDSVLVIDLKESGTITSIELKNMSNNKADKIITNSGSESKALWNIQIDDLQTGIWQVELTGTIGEKAFKKKHKFIIE